MNVSRRYWLKTLTQGAGCLALLSAFPRLVFAGWNKKAFIAKDLTQAIQAMYGSLPIKKSTLIHLKAPTIAENGAVVPITVESKIDKTESISLFVPDNPGPLVAKFSFSDISQPFVKTRIRMGKTSKILVLVKADGKLYSTEQAVKVTIGGCGG
jgi:sulfur-oxidizing protein SoxY